MGWLPPHLTRQQREARRLHFAQTLQHTQLPNRHLREYYGVSKSGLHYWKQRLKTAGLEGLKARKIPGRQCKLTAEHLTTLKDLLQESALQHGYPDPTWTCRRVRDLIGLRFGIWYHPSHVFKILRRLGFSYQKPEKRAIERDEAKIAAWTEQVIPELQKHTQKGATLVFLDESGISLKTTTRKTWAVKGQTPLIKTRMNWEKLSVIGALTHTGHFYQHTLPGACNGSKVAQFLAHLLKHLQGDLMVVLDNAGIHKSRPVQDLLNKHPRMKLVFLPPYAPELNPIEPIWAVVKHHILGNRLARTLKDLKSSLRPVWTRIRRLDLQKVATSGMWEKIKA
ncbi:IS630 family transposase [Deinococcus cellulosilyticus]|uniref:IS630 family transposase n=1 Tax=Deinococcus cellulosilyticus (strain DSM 18568 / NBRC 106333 / KACC 11606 / 5516J-15) TaxID=1223518 RepID=A0A511NBF2_DEIC1|nr:IS630 family transposase [Deinococcus cellulosilyticus]GEM50159.1 hypothetical protein DC3_57940 [Deinococcus cellulosilyticus NBRC 106333 = KACC 11606]